MKTRLIFTLALLCASFIMIQLLRSDCARKQKIIPADTVIHRPRTFDVQYIDCRDPSIVGRIESVAAAYDDLFSKIFNVSMSGQSSIRILVFGTSMEIKRYYYRVHGKSIPSTSFFDTTSNEVYLTVDNHDLEFTTTALVHELTHAHLSKQFGIQDFWIQEGLASYFCLFYRFENEILVAVSAEKEKAIILAIREHARSKGIISATDLVSIAQNSVAYVSEDLKPKYIASLVCLMLWLKGKCGAEFFALCKKYIDLRTSGSREYEHLPSAFRDSFGIPVYAAKEGVDSLFLQ